MVVERGGWAVNAELWLLWAGANSNSRNYYFESRCCCRKMLIPRVVVIVSDIVFRARRPMSYRFSMVIKLNTNKIVRWIRFTIHRYQNSNMCRNIQFSNFVKHLSILWKLWQNEKFEWHYTMMVEVDEKKSNWWNLKLMKTLFRTCKCICWLISWWPI